MKKELDFRTSNMVEYMEIYRWTVEQCRYYGWQLRTENNSFYDLGVSFMYLKKITPGELSEAPWINFHPAPLPELRGRNVAYQAIINKMKYFGATVHYVDAEFDTGPIIEVERFPIFPYHTAEDIIKISYDITENQYKRYIPKFLRGELVPATVQTSGNYFKKSEINDEIKISEEERLRLRALYCPPHYPYVKIGDRKFELRENKNELLAK